MVNMADNRSLTEILNSDINFVNDIIKYLLGTEMERGVSEINKLIPVELTNQILLYFIASGILDIMGKEINRSTIERLFTAGEFPVNRDILNGVAKIKFKNRMAYIWAILFLYMGDGKITLNKIINIIISFGLDPDIDEAKNSIEVFNEIGAKYGLKPVSIEDS